MPTTSPMEADDDVVARLLGRPPGGRYTVAVRGSDGSPIVLRNAPLLDDGTPMPTLYWLVGADQVAAVSRLEASGGVRAAEAAVDSAALADAHARYAAERDADVPSDAVHRPFGGVGGTRQGVKCLHAHYAWYLAGGDDPVGRWVAGSLAAKVTVDIGSSISLRAGTDLDVLPTTLDELVGELTQHDPPLPQALTNAIGAITDDVDNLVQTRPAIGEAGALEVTGAEGWHLATVERGALPDGATLLEIDRAALEDVFRTLVTETRADRLHNPGLRPERADSVVATCCTVLAVVRLLQCSKVSFVSPSATGSP